MLALQRRDMQNYDFHLDLLLNRGVIIISRVDEEKLISVNPKSTEIRIGIKLYFMK
jgi:hypothetical protein